MTKNIQGTIKITSFGGGYLYSKNINENIYIPFHLLNTALNNDEVEIVIEPKKEGERIIGSVKKVISRKKTRFVGTVRVEKEGKFAFLTADDYKMYVPIFIPKIPLNLKNNTKVLVEFIQWANPQKNPVGKILKIIGKKGDNNTEMESIVLENGFDIEFSDSVEKEAKDIKKKSQSAIKEEIKKRRDFRNVLMFTIDSERAKDYDDAISFKKISEELYEIGVHIADVSYWVSPQSFIDKEAIKRGFSVYLIDRTIPMLPEILSNDLCSLNPNEDKLTFSVVFTISKDGNIKKTWFGETIISSKYKFTYEAVQKILDGKDGPFSSELRELIKITRNLRKKRIENGALEFAHNEIEVILDKNSRPIKIYIKKGIESQQLIEELMVLANKEIAFFLGGRNNMGLCIFRISEKPEQKNIDEALLFLKKFGYNIEIKKQDKAFVVLNNLLKKTKETDDEFLVRTIILRSLSKAIYSVDNKGHFAMALHHYTHFTSPIRRYADLLVHRALKKKLKGKMITQEERTFYKKTAEKLTGKEADSASAERNSVVFKQIEYMIERIGEIRKGIIIKVANWGVYVQEIETQTEGMVRLKNIDDDFYVFDEESFSITGVKTKKRYQLGDRVKIKIIGGDIEKRMIDYTFV